MTPLKDRLPPFKSLLSPEERAKLEAMSEEERKAFFHALATSLLVREPLTDREIDDERQVS